MLNTIQDLKDEVVVRLSQNTTATASSGITETILKDWIKQAYKFATSYHKWPFTEGRIQTTFATGGGPGGDEWYFEGYKADSFRLVQVGGKRLQKLNFEDYQIFREEQPDSDDRVYSDFGRTVFINPNADVSGSLVAWGQYEPILDVTDEAGTTIFSGYDEEGNEAIVEEILSYAKERQQKQTEAVNHHGKAVQILENIWKRIQDEQALYQTHPARGGWFKRINVVDGFLDDEEFKRKQF